MIRFSEKSWSLELYRSILKLWELPQITILQISLGM